MTAITSKIKLSDSATAFTQRGYQTNNKTFIEAAHITPIAQKSALIPHKKHENEWNGFFTHAHFSRHDTLSLKTLSIVNKCNMDSIWRRLEVPQYIENNILKFKIENKK